MNPNTLAETIVDMLLSNYDIFCRDKTTFDRARLEQYISGVIDMAQQVDGEYD